MSSRECSLVFNIKPPDQISKAIVGAIAVKGKNQHGRCSQRCPWFQKGRCLAAELYERADPVMYGLFSASPEPLDHPE